MSFYFNVLIYHNKPFCGKLFINTSKLIYNNFYLSLSYTPGVSLISNLIYKDFFNIYKYTIKKNLVCVLTNGSAVLGLGNLGPFSSKPVMEGKSILFKKFADINSFDLEIFESNSLNLKDIILSLECTFGGINLEDIKSPECFYLENELINKSSIPIFHDDQHGTAVVVCSAIINSLILLNKNIFFIKILVIGAGAASIASLNLLLKLGFLKKNIFVFDSKGSLSSDRLDLNDYKKVFINFKNFILFKNLNFNFDLLLGCSSSNLIKSDFLKLFFKNSIILSLSNPIPEIFPEIIKFIRNDILIFTGRSDYFNQVNNLIFFPFVFRGSLDALLINIIDFLKLKCVFILSKLVFFNFLESKFIFKNFFLKNINSNYSIISPFDVRLIVLIPFTIFKFSIIFGLGNNYLKNYFFYLKKLSLISLR